MAQLQNALGGGSPLGFGVGYRVPDTNINVQYTYQQGRTNVQISCVPDEQVSHYDDAMISLLLCHTSSPSERQTKKKEDSGGGKLC